MNGTTRDQIKRVTTYKHFTSDLKTKTPNTEIRALITLRTCIYI